MLGNNTSLKEWSGTGMGCHGGGGVTIPGGAQEKEKYHTEGHGLVGVVVMG